MNALIHLKETLISRLKAKGIAPDLIPSVIRCLTFALVLNPQAPDFKMKDRLECMGWDELELDADTLKIIKDYFNGDLLKVLENKPARWFEKEFKAA